MPGNEILPSKDLTREEQIKVMRSTPEWVSYRKELEGMINTITSKMDNCKPEEIGKLQGEKQGLKTALNLITEIN